MRHLARHFTPAALLLIALSSCSRSVAPNRSASASLTAAAAPGSFRVRLRFVGPTVSLDRQLRPIAQPNDVFFVTSDGTFDASAPLDTVPAHSELVQVTWRRTPPGSTAGAEAALVNESPGAVHTAAGPLPQTFAPGFHLLVLEAPQSAGGGEATVGFYVGFQPGAWWAGPDPALFPPSSDGDGRAVDVTDWSHFTTSPAWPPDGRGYFGPDSFRTVPSQRRPVGGDFERKTFYEIFGDRIYARSEGDVVHQDAWVVFVNGGYDRDSPYAPFVVPSDPGLPAGFASSPDLYSVLIDQGFIGSPVGFRFNVPTRLTNGNVLLPSETLTYPRFDPLSVLREPHVAGYWRVIYPGKAYAITMGADADEQISFRDPVAFMALADRVDAGGGTPAERALRRRILTFQVRAAAAAP